MTDKRPEPLEHRLAAIEQRLTNIERRLNQVEGDTLPFRRIGPNNPDPSYWQPSQPFRIKTDAWNQCPKCGLKLDQVMSYTCTVSNCPTGLGGAQC